MKAWIEKGWLFLSSKKKFSSRLPLEFICSSGSSYLMAFELEHQFFLDLVHAVTHRRYRLASPYNRVEPIPYYLLLSLCNTHPVPFSGEPWLITVINYVNRQTKNDMEFVTYLQVKCTRTVVWMLEGRNGSILLYSF